MAYVVTFINILQLQTGSLFFAWRRRIKARLSGQKTTLESSTGMTYLQNQIQQFNYAMIVMKMIFLTNVVTPFMAYAVTFINFLQLQTWTTPTYDWWCLG